MKRCSRSLIHVCLPVHPQRSSADPQEMWEQWRSSCVFRFSVCEAYESSLSKYTQPVKSLDTPGSSLSLLLSTL